jgi:aspartate/tyrosine/aromatic aminotransferase
MAIKKNITLNDQFNDSRTYNNAYIRVDIISGTKHSINFGVGYYKDETAKHRLMQSGFELKPTLSGANFIEQAYLHLKTLPEFADAVDC